MINIAKDKMNLSFKQTNNKDQYNPVLHLKTHLQTCVRGNFSLELGQLDPRHEKSVRCLSIILATILLSSNPKWPPSAMMKISGGTEWKVF